MKIFIPYVDELRGVDAPLVPFDNCAMRVIRVEAGGEQTDAVSQIIMEFQRGNAEYNIEPKTRYGSVAGTGATDI
ncbi:MAG: hypothetical protein VXA68_11910 [Gammaproteobacteria bacterium]